MPENELLIELYSDPRFVKLIKKILEQRPVIPTHDPRSDNTEEWKSKSAEQRGFDVWCTYLRTTEALNGR